MNLPRLIKVDETCWIDPNQVVVVMEIKYGDNWRTKICMHDHDNAFILDEGVRAATVAALINGEFDNSEPEWVPPPPTAADLAAMEGTYPSIFNDELR